MRVSSAMLPRLDIYVNETSFTRLIASLIIITQRVIIGLLNLYDKKETRRAGWRALICNTWKCFKERKQNYWLVARIQLPTSYKQLNMTMEKRLF